MTRVGERPIPSYPDAPAGSDLDGRLGLNVPDPYRWLEEPTPAVVRWQREQTTLAREHVEGLPQFQTMRRRVASHYVGRPPAVPRWAAGKWFRLRTVGGAAGQEVVAADEPMAEGQVLADLTTLAPDNALAFLSWLSPSPDGRYVAVGVCADGSEANAIVVLDTSTGRALAEAPAHLLFDSWGGGAVWWADSTGFFYVAAGDDPAGPWQAVHRHSVVNRDDRGREAIPTYPGAWRDYIVMAVSRDGGTAVLSSRLAAPTPFAICDLTCDPRDWRPFVTRSDCGLTGHVVGDEFIAVTDLGAPRGRLIAIPLDAADPNDDTKWRELVPEGPNVLRTVTPVGLTLYLTEMVDTYSHVRVVDLRGQPVCDLPLPAAGAIAEPQFPLMTLVPRGHPDEFVFAHSTLTSSWALYRHRPDFAELEELLGPAVVLSDAVVVDLWATSPDGTRVPYHVVKPRESTDGPLPALIWGYGGFNIANVPQFPGAMAAVVDAGGLFVHAHLRGGAEFGNDWWHAGRGVHKQRTFDDLYAIAEDLIRRGLTTPDQLALTGGSNGGLLCGVAVTQRPDLFRAVVPQVPILDLVGALRSAYGEATIREYADPEDIDELHRLLTISPYHLIKDGTGYPAVFVVAGDADPRCPAWHASKWVARLQRAQASDQPVLLRVWEGVGHGLATPSQTATSQATEWLTFVAAQIGLR